MLATFCLFNLKHFGVNIIITIFVHIKDIAMTLEELRGIAYARAIECKRNMFKSEKKVWDMLQRHNKDFGLTWETQVPIIIPYDMKEEYESKAFYILDFLELRTHVVIEVDGEQHNPDEDEIRDSVLQELGYTTYRIKSLDVWKWDKLKNFICDVYDWEGIFYRRNLI